MQHHVRSGKEQLVRSFSRIYNLNLYYFSLSKATGLLFLLLGSAMGHLYYELSLGPV
jgi:hypothetical protein